MNNKKNRIESLCKLMAEGKYVIAIAPKDEFKAMERSGLESILGPHIHYPNFILERPPMDDVHRNESLPFVTIDTKLNRLNQVKMRYLYKEGNILLRADKAANRRDRTVFIKVYPG